MRNPLKEDIEENVAAKLKAVAVVPDEEALLLHAVSRELYADCHMWNLSKKYPGYTIILLFCTSDYKHILSHLVIVRKYNKQ